MLPLLWPRSKSGGGTGVRALYRTWLEFAGLLVLLVLWLFWLQGEACWWQPMVLWVSFTVLFSLTKHFGYDASAILLVAVLVLWGWVFLHRLNPAFAQGQFWGALVGSLAYLVGLFGSRLRFGHALLWDQPLFWLFASLGLVVITTLFGQTIGGAKAWLTVFNLRFQPVELARVFFVIFLGHHLSKGRKRWELVLSLVVFFLTLAWQRDLGPALLVFLVFCSLSLYQNFSWLKLMLYLGTMVLGFLVAILCFPHLQSRALAWLRPWEYLDGKGYQVLQGLFALRAGGFVGQGLGSGLAQVIPEGHTDYLFAIIGEEFGFLGTSALLLLYLSLAFWALRLLHKVQDQTQKMLGLGLTFLLHGQVFLVVGGILRFLPFTGMTLPFVSFGSTSLAAQFLMLGLVTSFGRNGGAE